MIFYGKTKHGIWYLSIRRRWWMHPEKYSGASLSGAAEGFDELLFDEALDRTFGPEETEDRP
jgi:hypothetical protein